MKTLLTPTQLIAVEVPGDSKNFSINPYKTEMDNTYYGLSYNYNCTNISKEYTEIIIGANKVSILGCVNKGVIDFDCKPYLEYLKINHEQFTYQYIKNGFIFHTSSNKLAFKDFLESHGLSLDKKYLIIKPKN